MTDIDRRSQLEKALAAAWDAIAAGVESRAPLLREVRVLNKELAELAVEPEGESKADELARKRRERLATTAPASRRSQPRRSGRGL